jgi:hypothetical protein
MKLPICKDVDADSGCLPTINSTLQQKSKTQENTMSLSA